MRALTLCVLTLVQVTFGYTSLLQKSWRCYAWDTRCISALTRSLEANFIQGIPGIGTVRLDPVKVDYVKLEQDGLSLDISDSTFRGFKNWILDELSPKTNVSVGRALFRTDLYVTGLYKIEGSLLFIPVKGCGSYTGTMKSVELEVTGPKLRTATVNGVDYIEASDYTFKFEVKGEEDFRFYDDYYGNSLFNDLMNYLLNYNWKFVTSTYGKGFTSKVFQTIGRIHKSYFQL